MSTKTISKMICDGCGGEILQERSAPITIGLWDKYKEGDVLLSTKFPSTFKQLDFCSRECIAKFAMDGGFE